MKSASGRLTPQPKGGKKKAVQRIRHRLNITISDEARGILEKICEANGITISRLVEMMARQKLHGEGLL